MSVSIWEIAVPSMLGYFILSFPGNAKWENTMIVGDQISMFFSVEPCAKLKYRKFKVIGNGELIDVDSLGYRGTVVLPSTWQVDERARRTSSSRVRHIIEVPND